MSESLNNITLAILNLLDYEPMRKPTIQALLSRALFTSTQAVGKAVARLTKSGHIHLDENKHSLHLLTITPKGKSLLKIYITIS